MRQTQVIPALDLKRQYQSIRPQIQAAIERVVSAQEFILGSEVEAFEREAAAYLGAKHAIGVASGTDALLLALRAVGVQPGDLVITVPFTFFATAGTIANLGATPVFVDIDPDTFNMDPTALEDWALHHPREVRSVKAVLPVHLFGQPADMVSIQSVADRHGWRVIEDAAQAMGATYTDRKAGALGDLGCFSFYPTKNLGAYGDGGLVVTNDSKLAEQVGLLHVHGARQRYFHDLLGTNSRLDALQATVLRVKLPHLDEWVAGRQRVAAAYVSFLRDVPGVTTPVTGPERTHAYHQYTIRVRNGHRDQLQKTLKEAGIGTTVYYPQALHLQKALAFLGYRSGDFPVSERACTEVLSLPIFAELREDEIRAVAEVVREFAVEGTPSAL